MMLNELKVKNAKPKEKLYRLFDGRGLYLEVNPAGGRYWRFKYRFNDKERRMGFGVYPDIGLADARERRDQARKLIANGVDPAEAKQAAKVSRAGGDSFEAIAREWHSKNLHMWTEAHGISILRRLEQNTFPWIGAKPIKQITPPEMLSVLRRMEERGAVETAHRMRSSCGQIFRYAIATGRIESDPCRDLIGAIAPVKKRHFPTITDPTLIGGLLRAFENYEGGFATKCALKLAPMLFVRPGELRHAEWSEFDFEKAEWRIPGKKMKMRVQHIVPLPTQAIAIIKELKALTGEGAAAKYLFPSVRSYSRPMSDNTINSALRRMGFEKDLIVGHGFRAMASTLLNEQRWKPDAIERQLAHSERNNVRAAYNYAEYLPERREMMQGWADYLDKLRTNHV